MKNAKIGVIGSIIFLVIILVGFFIVWNGSSSSSSAYQSDAYSNVDISGIISEASKLTANAENNANIPIPVPTTKLGKTNPFVAPQ